MPNADYESAGFSSYVNIYVLTLFKQLMNKKIRDCNAEVLYYVLWKCTILNSQAIS